MSFLNGVWPPELKQYCLYSVHIQKKPLFFFPLGLPGKMKKMKIHSICCSWRLLSTFIKIRNHVSLYWEQRTHFYQQYTQLPRWLYFCGIADMRFTKSFNFFTTLALSSLQHFTFLLNSNQKELTKLPNNRKLRFQNKQWIWDTSEFKQWLTAQLYCCK